MLQFVRSVSHLKFDELMAIYQEGNREKAEEVYPDLPEAFGMLRAEQDFYQYLRDSFFRDPNAFYCLWSVDDRYVSALRLEPYRDGLLLEALETAPGHRRKGFALQLLSAVLESLPEGKVYSHVMKNNVPSLRLHEKCGFSKIADLAAYIDGSVNHRAVTLCYEKKEM